jgi:hypothetical protein
MVTADTGSDADKSGVPRAPDMAEARRVALEYWQTQYEFYVKHARRQKHLFFVSQTLTVVLAALTPVLILGASEATVIPGWIQALPAALAAVTAGLSGTFRWQRNWAVFSESTQLLKSEYVKFMTQATLEYQSSPGDRESERNATSRFVQRVSSIALSETTEWREQLLTADNPANTK